MKENYRKAAHVMFECGSRLGLELVTVVGLKKQVLLNHFCNLHSFRLFDQLTSPGTSLFGDHQLPATGQP